MRTLRPLARHPLAAWRALDQLMGKAAEPARQSGYRDVPRLRLLFAGFQSTSQCPGAPAGDPHAQPAMKKSGGSWWHTGFPGWWMI